MKSIERKVGEVRNPAYDVPIHLIPVSRFLTWHLLPLLFFFIAASVHAQTTINGPTQVCVGEEPTYTVTPSEPGYSYVWSATGATLSSPSGQANQKVLFNADGSVTITVSITDANAVSVGSASIVVQADDLPVARIRTDQDWRCTEVLEAGAGSSIGPPYQWVESESDCFQVCEGSTVTYSTEETTGYTYTWLVDGAQSFVVNNNEVTVTWPSTPGFGFVKLVEANGAHCIDSTKVCINIIEKPTADFSVQPGTNVCLNQAVYFIDQSTDAVNWHWDFGNGETLDYSINDPNPLPKVEYTQSGTYQVTLTVENECHCTDTYTTNIVVSPNSAPEIVCIGVECANNTATYQCLTQCNSYNWNVTNGNVVSSSGDVVVVEWTAGAHGILEVLTSGCGNGCPNALVYVPVIDNSVTIQGKSPVCANSQERYWVPKMPGTTYGWNVSNGTLIAGHFTNEITVNWSTVNGTVSLTYDNPVLDCGGTATKPVTIEGVFNISGPEYACRNTTTTFTPSNGTSFDWEIKDDDFNTVFGPSAVTGNFTNDFDFPAGTYTVYAYDNASAFCNEVATAEINVVEVPELDSNDIIGEDEICLGRGYEFSMEPTSEDYFLDWTTSIGGNPSQVQGDRVLVEWNAVKPWIVVRQRSKDFPQCSSSTVRKTLTQRKFTGSILTALGPYMCEAQLTSTFTDIDKIQWSVNSPDASIIDGQGTTSPTFEFHYDNTSTYPKNLSIGVDIWHCGALVAAYPWTIQYTKPLLPELPASPVSVCAGAPFSVSLTNANLYPGSATFTWDVDGQIQSGGTTLNHTFTEPGSYVVKVTRSGVGAPACGNPEVSVVVEVLPVPIVSVTTPDHMCLSINSPVNLYCTVEDFGSFSNYTYDWGGGLTTSDISVTTGGSYFCTVTNLDNGCSASDGKYVSANCSGGSGGNTSNSSASGTPPPSNVGFYPIEITPTANACGDFTFSVLPLSGSPAPTNLNWSVTDPFSTSTTGTGSSFSHAFSSSGYHSVTVSGTFTWGPPPTTDQIFSTQIVYVPLIADFLPEFECDPANNKMNVKLKDLSDWTNLQGSFTYTSSAVGATALGNHTFSMTPGSTATFTWTVSHSSGEVCTKTKTITAPDMAEAIFDAPSVACEGVAVDMNNTSTGDIASYFWDFGDGGIHVFRDASRTYIDAATSPLVDEIVVWLKITDVYGCADSVSDTIAVYENDIDVQWSIPATKICEGAAATLTATNNGSFSTDFLWSTGSATSSTLVTETGEYYLTATNSLGCEKRYSHYMEVVPSPDAFIRGPLEYCLGEEIERKAFQGDDFDYAWSAPSGVSTTGLAQGNLTAFNAPSGPNAFSVTVTETYSGLSCTDVSTPNNVLVKAPLTPPTITASGGAPYCMDGARTLSTSNPATGDFTWSTGGFTSNSTTSSISVDHPGLYAVTFTDASNCSDSGSFKLHALPDFSEFMSGCYDVCLDELVDWPGIPGNFLSYTWYRNGVVVSSGTAPSPGMGVYVSVPTLAITSPGDYQLEVTTINGCTAISPIASISHIPCDQFCTRMDVNFLQAVCIGQDENRNDVYFLEFGVSTFPFPGDITVNANGNGLVSNVNPASIGQVSQNFGFTYTNTSGNLFPCFDITFTSADPAVEYTCTFELCPELERCDELPSCRLEEIEVLSKECLVQSQNNFNTYSVSLNLFNGTSSPLEVVAVTDLVSNAPIAFAPGTVIMGSTQLDITFSSYLPAGTNQCLQVIMREVGTNTFCKEEVCFEIPQCEVEACRALESEIRSINCADVDAAGNPIYEVDFRIDNSESYSLDIVAITSTQGIVTNYPASLSSGSNAFIAFFTALPPFYEPVCFTIWVYDPQNDEVTPCEVCFHRLPCVSAGSVPGKRDFLSPETETATELVTGLKLMPNPTLGELSIAYSFYGESEGSLVIIDTYGRILFERDGLNEDGSLQLNIQDWAAGIYFVQSIQNNAKSNTQILVKE